MSIDKLNGLIKRSQELNERRTDLNNKNNLIQAELTARRRQLQQVIKEVTDEGLNPNDLKDEITSTTEIAEMKLNSLSADLDAAEKIIIPLLKEIERTG